MKFKLYIFNCRNNGVFNAIHRIKFSYDNINIRYSVNRLRRFYIFLDVKYYIFPTFFPTRIYILYRNNIIIARKILYYYVVDDSQILHRASRLLYNIEGFRRTTLRTASGHKNYDDL